MKKMHSAMHAVTYLLRKYGKLSSDDALQFIRCLTNMAIRDDKNEDLFEENISRWLNKVDHGGALLCK